MSSTLGGHAADTYGNDLMARTGELHRVFAYGSNMHQEDLARWFEANEFDYDASVLGLELGYLVDHTLVWNYLSPVREGGAANVGAAPGKRLPGVILEVDASGLEAIDRKEGYPDRYGRRLETIAVPDGVERQAWVYRVTDAYRREGFTPPRRNYLDLIIAAAERFRFNDAYLEWLRSLETAD